MRFLLLGLLWLWPLPAPAQPSSSPPPLPDTTFALLFEEVWQTVHDQFYDPGFNGVDWTAARIPYAARAARATSLEDLAVLLNEMLALLRTSHTHLYTPLDPAYHHLLDIFSAGPLGKHIPALYPDGILSYPGIGLFTVVIDGEPFVRGALEGGPAHRAGLRTGDRLIDVDGAPFHPIRSFQGTVGRPVPIMIQRTPDPQSRRVLYVVPEHIKPRDLFLRAQEQSVRLIERDSLRIGYVRLWSYAGEVYHERLQEELAFGRLRDAAALILDLRGGWGGANPTYLNLFNTRVPRITQIERDGQRRTFDLQWRKPVALLVDEETRSGKEVLAYGFKRYGIGPVVGSRTAGAVVGGRPFLLTGGVLLYLAVADALVEGERLEGVGVAPDVDVPFSIPYADGHDPQLDAAIRTLVQQ